MTDIDNLEQQVRILKRKVAELEKRERDVGLCETCLALLHGTQLPPQRRDDNEPIKTDPK